MKTKTITLSSGAIRQQLYYFSCNNCRKERQTVFKKHADNRVCRRCRHNKVNDNQAPLFEIKGIATPRYMNV